MRSLATACLLVALAGCGKEEDSSKGSPTTPSTEATAPAPGETPADAGRSTALVKPPPEEVILSLSVNSATTAEVWKGWPIIVEATLRLTPESKGAKTVTGTNGPWSEALRLTCTGPDGKDISAQFQPAFPSKPSLELTPDRAGLAVWVLEDADLPAGAYSFRVTVDSARVAGALPESLRSNRATLTVSTAAPAPGTEFRKVRAAIDAALWKGDPARALAAADAHLAKDPKDTVILACKAQVLRSQGKHKEALATLEEALKATREAKGDVKPLLRQIDALREEMRKK